MQHVSDGGVSMICQFLLMCEQCKSMTAQIVSAEITQSSNYTSAAITRSGTEFQGNEGKKEETQQGH